MEIKRWDGSPSPAFNLEYSTDSGANWTLVSAITNTTLDNSSAWKTFNGTINSANPGILIRLIATGSTERIHIDNFIWTGFAGGENTPPTITNITETPPIDVTSTTTVSISADVTDTDGTVALVQCTWGTISGVYPNTINMTASGDTYTTVTDIPAQADGTTVFYVIYAEDDDGAPITSLVQSYTVNDPATTTIPYVQDFSAGFGDCYTFSVSGDAQWYMYNSDNAAMNGYLQPLNEDWLVLPAINFDAYANERMTFNTIATYGVIDENNYLKLMYSTDYFGLGNPNTAKGTWTEIPFTPAAVGGGEASSGILDLSGISGTNVYLAFKYYSTDSPTRWEVDDISIFIASTPMLSVTPSTLTGFTYVVEQGPSALQSFLVSGVDLTGDVTITPPVDYEISTLGGIDFLAMDPIVITPAKAGIPETEIWVRLLAGLPIASYDNQVITVTSPGAQDKSVTCSGAVTSPLPTAQVLLRPVQMNIASATAESAILMHLENYPSDLVRYRLYSGSTQYYPWDAVTQTWVSSFSYGSGPLVPGTPSTQTTWWIPFQRGSNASVAASYRDRLDPYSSNYKTVALPTTSAITTPNSITQDQVTFSTWSDFTDKYILLGFDAVEEGSLICAASSEPGTGDFTLFFDQTTQIQRIEVRTIDNFLVESVTGPWTTYDYPTGVEVPVGDVSITFTEGFANNAGQAGGTPPNPNFISMFGISLNLIGAGPWQISFEADPIAYPWITYRRGTVWTSFENLTGFVSFEVTATKDEVIEIQAGGGENPTLPVELSSFTAILTANNFVKLNWVTQSETNVLGYYVFRAWEGGLDGALKISPLIGATNTASLHSYSFTDTELFEQGNYSYWLQSVDTDGSSCYFGPVNVLFNGEPGDPGAPELPVTTSLKAVYPNPFNPNARIPFDLANPSEVKISIFNSRGQLVRFYDLGSKAAGNHHIDWNGKDESGSDCATGVYYIRMRADGKGFSTKAVLMK